MPIEYLEYIFWARDPELKIRTLLNFKLEASDIKLNDIIYEFEIRLLTGVGSGR